MLRILEELFPAFEYLRQKKRKVEKIKKQDFEHFNEFEVYRELSPEILKERLLEEHKRADSIDEKTFKFTLAFSVGLAVLSGGATIFLKTVAEGFLEFLGFVLTSSAAFYMLVGGLTALGAIGTMPKYGFGTHFRHKLAKDEINTLVYALIGQEQVNLIRQMRNETAYLNLRNGFLLLIITLVLVPLYSILKHTFLFDAYCEVLFFCPVEFFLF